jgi:hypothetical protein
MFTHRSYAYCELQVSSVLDTCLCSWELIHQASSQFECLSLPWRRKRASYSVDSHDLVSSAKVTTSAEPLLPQDPGFVNLMGTGSPLPVAQLF